MTSHARARSRVRRALAWGFAVGILLPAPALAAPPTPQDVDLATAAAPATFRVEAQAAEEPATTSGRVSAAARPVVTLTGVSPNVVMPDRDVRITLAVRNGGRTAASGTVAVGVGDRLSTREDVARHASRPADLPTVVQVETPELAPGAGSTVTIDLPADRLRLPRPYGVLPVTVSVSGIGSPARLATFLPYQVVKEYEPLRLGVALPLTADPNPGVLDADAQVRTQAWTRMLGPDSRVDRTLEAAQAIDATVVTDPGLLGVSGDTSATSTATTDAAPAATDGQDPRALLAARLADSDDDVWFLPPGDPDVSALAAAGGTPTPLPVPPSTVPGTNRTALSVAWPAGTSTARVRDLVAGISAPTAVLMSESLSDTDTQRTGSASRRDASGRRIVVTDDRLSADLAQVTRETATSLTQRALADSVALLAESPGLDRSVLLLPERGIDPDPAALATLVRALRAAPWVTPVPAGDIVAAPATSEPVTDPDTTPSAPASPLTRETVDDVATTSRLAAGLRPAFGDGLIPADVESVLTSARWRGHASAWNTARADLRQRLQTYSRGVSIVPSMVNFFADHGALQITVVNDLDVEVHDIRLTADVAGRPSRLRILGAPEPLTIRPNSRATVRLDVEAIAAGVVPLTTSLRTPAGAPLGEDTTVSVRVQPTNGWILLAAGGVVGLVFLAGLFRAIRVGERRVADADLRGLDLD